MLEHCIHTLFYAGYDHLLHDVISKKIHEVEVSDIFVNTVTNIDIIISIIIRIEHKGTPAPVGCRHATVICNITELSFAIIQLQAVHHILIVKPCLNFTVVQVYVVECSHCF